MDEEGWIPLAVVANFNRVRMLTPDMMLIVDALRDSSVEVAKDSAYLRAKDTWSNWILPPQQRDLSHKPTGAKPEAAAAGSAQEEGAAAAPAAAEGSSTQGEGAAAAAVAAAGPVAAAVAQASPTKAAPAPSAPVPAPAAAKAKAKPAVDDDEENLDEDEDLFEMDEVGQKKEGVGLHASMHACIGP